MISASALFGIVDLGTWNIRFSINSIQPHHARILPCVFQDRAPIRLYKGLDVPITQEEIADTLVALRRFTAICVGYGVPPQNVRVAANPHEAPNFDELVTKINDELKLEVLRLSREGEHWASAYCVASSVYEARGIYIELRPSHANLYYLNLSNLATDPEKSAVEALIGPVKVYYLPNTRYRVQSPADGTGEREQVREQVQEHASDPLELNDFQQRLADACATLAEKAQAANTASTTVFLSSSGFFGLHTLLASAASGSRLVTNGLVVPPAVLARLETSSKLARVVRTVGASLPSDTRRVVYVHHNLRNGLLFQALPPPIRHQDPLIVATQPYALPGAPRLAEELRRALPAALCPAFVRDRLAYAASNAAYVHSSYSTEVQSVSALLVAQTGVLAGTHGVTHEEKALLGLALCQRWGGFLGLGAGDAHADLVSSVAEPALVCWAMYSGLVLYLLGAAYPGAHVRPDAVKVSAEVTSGTGFRLVVTLQKDSLFGDNVIMDARIKRVRAKLASLEGVDVEMDVVKTPHEKAH